MSNIFQFPSPDLLDQKLRSQIDDFNNQLFQLVLNFKQNDQFKQMYHQVTESELTDNDIAALFGNTVGLTLFRLTDKAELSVRMENFLEMYSNLNRGLSIFKDTIIKETNAALNSSQGESNE